VLDLAYMDNHLPFGHYFPAFLFVLIVVFAFEVCMFVHAIKNDRLENNRKILWLIGMLFIHPFVAIAYYFTDYRLVS
jgi:hypothetical protein